MELEIFGVDNVYYFSNEFKSVLYGGVCVCVIVFYVDIFFKDLVLFSIFYVLIFIILVVYSFYV